jgi:hypothetical protein
MKTAKLLVMAVVVLTLCLGLAQAKANFTGDWKANAAKSDFGPMPPPEKFDQKITHNDPELKVATTIAGEFGEFTLDFTYKTDGKECVNTSPMGETKSVLTWDGDTLVIESKMSGDNGEMTMSDRWTLSEDGKTLTMKRHFSGGMGEGDQTMVMEKQ